MMKRQCSTLVLVLVAMAGCSAPDREGAEAPGAAARQPATPRAEGAMVSTTGWTVTPNGIGTLRTEMTLAEAGRQLGRELTPPVGPGPCTYLQPVAGLDSVAFMMIDGRIARFDITGRRVATVEGARVGDTRARIDSLYAGRVEVQPHEYTDGHYLVVRPMEGAHNAHRIIFETDGSRVTSYRAGRLPEVGWVEGCS